MVSNPLARLFLEGGVDVFLKLWPVWMLIAGSLLGHAAAVRRRAPSVPQYAQLGLQRRGARLLAHLRSIRPRERPARVFAELSRSEALLEEVVFAELERRRVRVQRPVRSGHGRLMLGDGTWLVRAQRRPAATQDLLVLEREVFEERVAGALLFTAVRRVDVLPAAEQCDHVKVVGGAELLSFIAGEKMALGRESR